jgi:hypothetical protein
MVFGKKKKILPPYQPSSPPPQQPQPQQPNNVQEEEIEQQEQKKETKYFTIKAKSILENKISLDELAEPYVIIMSRLNNIGEIGYVINILARIKGYRVVSFSTTRFFAYVIVEKE